jgi:hypothetical protein
VNKANKKASNREEETKKKKEAKTKVFVST